MPLQVDGGDAEVRVSELALDDVEGAFLRGPSRLRDVAQLMQNEASQL